MTQLKSTVWKIPVVSKMEAYVRFPNEVTEEEALETFKKDMNTGVERAEPTETIVGFHATPVQE